jgi:hypothetical protein
VDSNGISGQAGVTVAVAGLLGVLLALMALLDIGPCAEEELTRAEFLAQGDEICARAHDEFLELQARAPLTPSDAAELTGGLIEVAEEERDAIGDLSEPEELREPVDRYLEARDRGIELLREGQAAAEDADPAAYEELQAELASGQRDPRYRLAREIGFEECSKPLAPEGAG